MGLLSTFGAASGRAFGLTRVGAAIKDAYFNLTTLLLPGNGTNGAQNNTFLDSGTANSGSGFTITRNGQTTQGTFSPFSQTGWSVYFDGNASCDLAVASTAQFNWGTSDFCIEAFVYPQSFPTGARIINFGDGIFNFETNSSGYLSYFQGTSYTASIGALATNTWTHCVITRQSGTIRMFANGILVFTNTNTTSKGTSTANIGSFPSGGDTLLGYLSNLRVINGNVPAAYQTSSTTLGASIFSVPTTALTAVTGTALLTCQANRFVDNSGNNLSVTVGAGTPSVQAFSPFAPTAAYSAATNGGSAYSDGNGDYLTVASDANLTLGSSDFTIELWWYPLAFNGDGEIFTMGSNAGTNRCYAMYSSASNGTLSAYAGTGGTSWDIVSNLSMGTARQNAWNHMAFTRSGSTFSTYLNGSRIATTTASGTLGSSGLGIFANNSGTSQAPSGYIGGARTIKGTALYTGTTYTVPTAPFTAVTNTNLLLNFTNAGITDATAKNDLETVGNAQISTTQSKFGGASLAFDGTGDYLTAATNPAFLFNTGDFTVELWYYPTALTGTPGNAQALVGMWGPSSSNASWLFYLNAGNLYWYTSTNGSTQTATMNAASGMSAGNWYHLALCRSGGTTRIFVNGSSIVSTTTSVNLYNATCPLTVGYNPIGGTPDYVYGYIDDLRITKGFARYTANFTPPTAAFPLS